MNIDFNADSKRNGFFSTITKKLDDMEKFIRDHRVIQHRVFADVLGAHGNNATIPAGTTYYMTPFLSGLQTAVRLSPYPFSGVVKHLYLRIVTTQPASGSIVITVMKNNVATTLVLTIPAGSAQGVYSEIVTEISITAGDLISFSLQNNALAASAQIGGLAVGFVGSI